MQFFMLVNMRYINKHYDQLIKSIISPTIENTNMWFCIMCKVR